jgi:hypothetical protein
MKRVVFICSTIFAVVLGLDTIGGRPIAPGFDTKLRSSWSQTSQGFPVLRLETDAGDLQCWIRLRVSGAFQSEPSLNVLPRIIRSGVGPTDLIYRIGSSGAGWADLEVLAPGSPQEKFSWPSGRALEVLFASDHPLTFALDDWWIFLGEGEGDSQFKASWRHTWFWLSLGALILSVGTAIYTGWPRAERTSKDPLKDCLRTLVAQVEGASVDKTRDMQALLLRVVFDGAEVREALEGLKGPTGIRRSQVWLQARSRFLSRLAVLVRQLANEHARLRSLHE